MSEAKLAGELTYRSEHDEVVAALGAIGDPKLGEAIRVDRKSEMQYLGVRFPALRARVKEGFTFTTRPAGEVLRVWDDLWRNSPWGDVLFAALEYYIPVVRKAGKVAGGTLAAKKSGAGKLGAEQSEIGKVDTASPDQMQPDLWPVMRPWIERVDNWCHCDQLGLVYSYLLEQDPDAVFPQIVEWNRSDDLWQRRASLVSLVHYTGKNSVFLPPDRVLPLVENCVDDHRHYIQTAVGWVLREMSVPYIHEVRGFLDAHGDQMTGAARKRATERLK